MNLELAKFLFQVLTFLLTAAVGVYVYFSNKDKVTNDRIGKLEDDLDLKLDEHTQRITKLESGTLGHGDLSEMHNKINRVSNEMSALSGEFKGMRHLLNMINEHLVRGSK